jgi:flagellar biosynthesis chaperone FliJ
VIRRFRLAALERLRAARLREAAAELANARRALGAAQARTEELGRRLTVCVPGPRETPEGILVLARRRELLREQLQAGTEQVQRRRAEVQSALETWRTARAELQAVEELHERHRRALATHDARREQRTLDDLAGVAAARTRAGGTS